MDSKTSRLSPESVLQAIDDITAHVTASPNSFNLTAGDLSKIGDAHDDLASAVEAQRLSALDLKMKVGAKDSALAAARDALASATKVALASGATNYQLRQIGMARAAKPVRPLAIPAPTDLVATALDAKRARLAYGRGGASYGATYEIFASPDGLDYSMVATTTRGSIVLDQPAGQAVWYRVRAARSGLLSPFSNDATLYAPAAPARPQLRVA